MMNGKFRTSISGFHRGDVLKYIKQLSEENAELEAENSNHCLDLEEKNLYIETLEDLLRDCVEEIEVLQNKHHEITGQIEKYSNDVNRINADFTKFNDIYGKKLDNLHKQLSSTGSELISHTEKLASLISRIEGALHTK